MKNVIFSFGMAFILASGAFAQAFSPPPPIDAAQRPVLIYSESEYGKENVTIYAAYKQDGTWKRDVIVSAPFVALEQLDDSKFLVAAGATGLVSELYLTDLAAGTTVQITTRKGHCPIAFVRPNERYHRWKEANKAFLLQDGDGASDVEFITVDYAAMTYETKSLQKSIFGGKFGDDLRTKIGPNGTHIAFLESIPTTSTAPRVADFVLKVYHFSDGSVTTAAPRITAQVSEDAASPFGWPPFAWSEWEVLMYGNTVPVTKGSEADLVFSTTHVHKPEITELFAQRMPLTKGEPEIYRESPNILEILYRTGGLASEEFMIDPAAQVLMTYRDPRTLTFETTDGNAKVRAGNRLLFDALHFGGQVRGVTSPKLKHQAYALSTPPSVTDKERKAELFVNIGEGDAELAAGPVYYLRPLAWLE